MVQSGLHIRDRHFVSIANVRQQFQKSLGLALRSKKVKRVSQREEKKEHRHTANKENRGEHAVIRKHQSGKRADHFADKIAHNHGQT